VTPNQDVLEAARSTLWDVVIVGTGMGGATLGWALARAGWRVLFVEQGLDTSRRGESVVAGRYPECNSPRLGRAPGTNDADLLRRSGRYFDLLTDISHGRPRPGLPFIGAGTGGSSALYGMVLERFRASDFEPHGPRPSTPGDYLVERWPVNFSQMLPHYQHAERLFRVRGGNDPLRTNDGKTAGLPSRPWSSPVSQLAEHLTGLGLHPYALPVSCDNVDGCESCQGYLCAKQCKVDATRACLDPARDKYGAQLLDACRAERLIVEGGTVTAVEVSHGGQVAMLRGRIVALAAGALRTPALLLNSASPDSPQGLANRSGLVGRLLMRHLIDVYALQLRQPAADQDNRRKEIGFSDYYELPEGKLGTVQSFGRLPPAEMIVDVLREDLRHGRLPLLQHALAWAAPLVSRSLKPMVEQSLGLASQVEDFPYLGNYVAPDREAGPGAIRLHYRVGADDLRRVVAMRRRMRQALKGWDHRLLKQAENNQRIAHVCGTCRFGTDPSRSVLDQFNRAHELENLYVVDASFFPSSGGTNPALTIAANALRVAEHLGAPPASGAADPA
jgi:choline dehydrogenase-like flavoprotein